MTRKKRESKKEKTDSGRKSRSCKKAEPPVLMEVAGVVKEKDGDTIEEVEVSSVQILPPPPPPPPRPKITCPEALIAQASKYESVLDAGCGVSGLLFHIKAGTRVGVDACPKVIEHCQAGAKAAGQDVGFVVGDLSKPFKVFDQEVPPFECIVGMDILEHLERQRAEILLAWCERAATKCIIWFIPTGCFPYHRDDYNMGNEVYMTHRSSWAPEEMVQAGYEVWYYPDWHAKHPNLESGSSVGAMWCLRLQDDLRPMIHEKKRYP